MYLESVALQHRVVTSKRFEVESRRKLRTEPKIKYWNLKEEKLCRALKEQVRQALAEREELG